MLSSESSDPSFAGQRAALQQQAADLFVHFIEQIQRGPAGPWLNLNLTMPQLKMLLVIDWLGSTPMSQVAGRLGISLSAATGLIDRLVEHGLARREHDPRDRRVVRVAATAEGRALVVRLRSAGTERLSRVVERLSTEDLARCATVMAAVNRAAEAALQSAKTPCAAAVGDTEERG